MKAGNAVIDWNEKGGREVDASTHLLVDKQNNPRVLGGYDSNGEDRRSVPELINGNCTG